MSRRIHTAIAALAAVLCLAATAAAQTSYPVAVRVQTSVTGATFWVDGQPYQSSAVFNWPEGSKHTLEIRSAYLYENAPPGYIVDPKQYDPTYNTRFAFQGWTSSGGQSLGMDKPVQSITVDRKVTSYTASFTKEHGVIFRINDDPLVQFLGPCNGNERIIVGSNLSASRAGYLETSVCSCLSTSGYDWVPEGSKIQINPVAYAGYVFAGFTSPAGLTGYSAATLLVTKPVTVQARFVPARRVFLETAPYRGFSVLIDRNVIPTKRNDLDCLPLSMPAGYPYYAPGYPFQFNPLADPNSAWSDARVCTNAPLCNGELDLLPETDHVLGAPVNQTDPNGKSWVFDSWDIGDGKSYPQNSVVRIPSDPRPLTFTARFVEGAFVGFATSQRGLKLVIDGNSNPMNYGYQWGVGHTHTVSAPLEQRDSSGRLWRFKSWSNGGEAEQTFVVPPEAVERGMHFVATYELLGQLTINSEPGTLKFQVNGTECRTPCTLDRPAGEQVTISPVPEQAITPDTKIELTGWENGASGERSYTFSQEAHRFTARYQYSHRLTLLSDPEGGAGWKLEPAAGPGWYFTAGSPVEVDVKANEGFKFRRFDGALSGTFPQGSLVMSAPRTVVARFDEVPALPEGAVRNAAGKTPDAVVAPGSIISVIGVHLAQDFGASKTNPAAQALAGVTVHVGDSILPLVFVSPTEIQAQLYSHFKVGEQTLTVRIPGQPGVSTKFEIAANAPGLFRNPNFEEPVAEAYHTDGKAVTPDYPAKPGETILLCGTGFGRFKPHPLDGFLIPDKPEIPLADPFELFLDGRAHPSLSTFAQPGRLGRVVIRFQLGSERPAGAMFQLKVRVRERDSNTVLLPVERIATAEEPEPQEQ